MVSLFDLLIVNVKIVSYLYYQKQQYLSDKMETKAKRIGLIALAGAVCALDASFYVKINEFKRNHDETHIIKNQLKNEGYNIEIRKEKMLEDIYSCSSKGGLAYKKIFPATKDRSTIVGVKCELRQDKI